MAYRLDGQLIGSPYMSRTPDFDPTRHRQVGLQPQCGRASATSTTIGCTIAWCTAVVTTSATPCTAPQVEANRAANARPLFSMWSTMLTRKEPVR